MGRTSIHVVHLSDGVATELSRFDLAESDRPVSAQVTVTFPSGAVSIERVWLNRTPPSIIRGESADIGKKMIPVNPEPYIDPLVEEYDRETARTN